MDNGQLSTIYKIDIKKFVKNTYILPPFYLLIDKYCLIPKGGEASTRECNMSLDRCILEGHWPKKYFMKTAHCELFGKTLFVTLQGT